VDSAVVWLSKCDVEVEENGNNTRVCFTFLTALELFEARLQHAQTRTHVCLEVYPQ